MTPSTSRKLRRALRLAGWPALLLILGLASIAVVAETALRLSKPFMTKHAPTAFVPGVGLLLKPNAEIRDTNGLDFWTVSRANSLGFLDREPPSPQQAARSCHITIIGDSFVEASQVQTPQYHSLPPSAAARYRLRVHSTGFDLKSKALLSQASGWLIDTSYFAKWLHVKTGLPIHRRWQRQAAIYWAEHLRQRPAYRALLAESQSLPAGHPSLLAKEQLEFTAFALRQFAERAQRDGASLLVLSEFHLNDGKLKTIAGELGIAILSLHDYAAQQGLRLADLHWLHDWHWNPIGHSHAAAALLEYLKENQDVCGGSVSARVNLNYSGSTTGEHQIGELQARS